ncbi:Os1348 family NHLP clan protein [Candidatus Leptofilum sp.]|uniref:Os1348 family NHLP clan protein n=1 Tax=Candidatus Leptofilum sp. TaxID=3241576 RepID=UPI003B5CBE45
MSEALDQVVERAVTDKDFRSLLFSDLNQALEGYPVSDEERKLLENLDEDNFDEFAGGLGSRTTKGFMPGTG